MSVLLPSVVIFEIGDFSCTKKSKKRFYIIYLQLFYLSIIFGFSYFLSFVFQFAKILIISETTHKKKQGTSVTPLCGPLFSYRGGQFSPVVYIASKVILVRLKK